MTVLVTGGAGYIGSHTCVELIQAGNNVVVVDNFLNSSRHALNRIEELTGQSVPWYECDIRDVDALDRVFSEHPIKSVVHFAALKAVGESTENPLEYYSNNVGGTCSLCEVMSSHGVKRLVFSSSATVYGSPKTVPIPETADLAPTNPYGWTKMMVEQVLEDLCRSDEEWQIAALRYFNPVGAHPSGRIGEDPNGVPNNLMPYISQVAVGRREKLSVFGNDYPSRDGTGVRDYVHVVDLAQGHVLAVKALEKIAEMGPSKHGRPSELLTVNLGTGCGYTVLEVVRAFEEVSGKTIEIEFAPRRPGDIAECFADPKLAEALLGWRTERDIKDMCRDAWRWQSQNPRGYEADE